MLKKYALVFLISNPLIASQSLEHEATSRMTDAANAFIATLNEAQKENALLPFTSDDRYDWHYVPKSRKGLALKELNESQRKASWAFFGSVLSKTGLAKAHGVIECERILWENDGRSDYRDPDKYFICVFGEPSNTGSWGASLEGHHLSINLTIVDGNMVSLTPSFFGANPDDDNQGHRPLAGERDQAVALLDSLSPEQRLQASLSGRVPREIITRAQREADVLALKGLAASEMSDQQKAQLMVLVYEYIGRYRQPFAQNDLDEIKSAGVGNIHFAWSGDTELGEPFYYRVQGPSFLLEYANVQRGGNHAHTVWRDFQNDFGKDYLKRHIEDHH